MIKKQENFGTTRISGPYGPFEILAPAGAGALCLLHFNSHGQIIKYPRFPKFKLVYIIIANFGKHFSLFGRFSFLLLSF